MIATAISGRYEIEAEIGRGGTALVYRARDRVGGMHVAIKILRPDVFGEINVERFLREIRLTSQLPHPHILPVLDSGEFEGRPFCVLPYMDGGTLRNRLDREKQLPLKEVIELGATIARALDFAHRRGLLHRDVKPENILYSGGGPCLADFGIARALDHAFPETSTSTGIIRGTPAYMSPEQVSGDRDYDGRTDIYSLGCVLYEAIAGVQAFMGPTSQVIIAQRLMHSPRSVRVYRPTVPLELEAALEKATAMAPADRFATAGDFAKALDAAIPALDRPIVDRASTAEIAKLASRRRLLIAAVAVGLVAAGGMAVRQQLVTRDTIALDTARVVVLPFEVRGRSQQLAPEELVADGLRQWTGVSTVETFATRDAIEQRSRSGGASVSTAGLGLPALAELTRGLGAARYIRGQITDLGPTRKVYAALYDAVTGRELYHAELPLPDSESVIPKTFADLAELLMLRGATEGTGRRSGAGTRSLPGTQAFLAGKSELARWNLNAADSLFRRALDFDASYASANLWVAQVGSWRGRSAQSWRANADRARHDTLNLTPAERLQAAALAALSSAEYPQACGDYRRMMAANAADFGGWYGLAECHRLDRVVVPDDRSPTHWRYRSSYEQAIQAYKRAFEILPTAYRGLEGGAFESLRLSMWTVDRLRLGQRVGGQPAEFLASLSFDHDTVLFTPYPRDSVYSQAANDALAKGLSRNRTLFYQIVSRWQSALPGARATKEAVAISLEMLGDAAAADSFHVLRQSATDAHERLRLAVEESVVRLKLGVSGSPTEIRAARLLADSILATSNEPTAVDADLLSRVAVMTGRCADAARFARIGEVDSIAGPGLSPSLAADTRAAYGTWAAGCAAQAVFPKVAEVLRRSGKSQAEADAREYQLIGSVIALRYPENGADIRRLAAATGDYVLVAEAALLDGKRADARAILDRYKVNRLTSPPGSLQPDAALIEARLWADVGDTTSAIGILDRLLDGLRYLQPMSKEQLTPNMLRLGSIAAALELRASLATADRDARKKWTAAVAELWASGDREIVGRVARLRAREL